jgi:hypothetical protein
MFLFPVLRPRNWRGYCISFGSKSAYLGELLNIYLVTTQCFEYLS